MGGFPHLILYSNDNKTNMIIKTIIWIIKLIITIFVIVIIVGYPIVVHDANPFTYYWDVIANFINGIKNIKSIF